MPKHVYLRSTCIHAFVGSASETRSKERLGDLFHEGSLTTSAPRLLEIAQRFEEHGGERAPFLFKALGARDLARPMSQLLTEPWLRAGLTSFGIDA